MVYYLRYCNFLTYLAQYSTFYFSLIKFLWIYHLHYCLKNSQWKNLRQNKYAFVYKWLFPYCSDVHNILFSIALFFIKIAMHTTLLTLSQLLDCNDFFIVVTLLSNDWCCGDRLSENQRYIQLAFRLKVFRHIYSTLCYILWWLETSSSPPPKEGR